MRDILKMEHIKANCACGNVELKIFGSALFRLFCHCTICQRFNGAPFADVVIYKAAQVSTPPTETVSFSTLKPPPNAQRGKCIRCHKPIIEKIVAPIFPKLTVVPASAHNDLGALPDSIAHVFYDKRIHDSNDSLPKYRGYVSSQFAFLQFLFAAK